MVVVHVACNKKKIEFTTDSNLKKIDERAFEHSSLCSFSISLKVEKMGDNSFNNCKNLQIIDIQENSQSESFQLDYFFRKF